MYGKHYESMYTGSMRGKGAVAFAVLGYIIAHVKPPSFELELNPEVIGFLIGETEEKIAGTLEGFCNPDPKSRTPDHEGRKLIKRGMYLYFVVNGEAYHKIRSDEDKRSYWRDQKRKQKKPEDEGCGVDGNGEPGSAYHKDSRTVLHLLNESSGRHFRETDTNLGFISARLNESGVELAGVRQMIARQCSRWKGTDQAEYLRPETLFNETKFDGYYAAKDLPVEVQNSAPPSKKFTPPNPHNEVINVRSL